MKTNSPVSHPTILPESSLIAYPVTRKNRPGIVKLLPPPVPPDEKTIRRLNEIAAKHPFCTFYKARKYDLL
jgi:hypothetical protein